MVIFNASSCPVSESSNAYSVNFSGAPISTGQTWYISTSDKKKFDCVEITSTTNEPTGVFELVTQYTDCLDCYSQNYGIIRLEPCYKLERAEFILPISGFTGVTEIPKTNDVFYLDVVRPNGDGTYSQLKTCFSVKGVGLVSETEFNSISGAFSTLNLPVTAYTDCRTCLENNLTTTMVRRCNSETNDYVSILDPASIIGNLISYSDGINQYCGTVSIESPLSPPSFTMITNFGEQRDCDICLDVSNDKRIIQSCTDPNIQEVVWASSLFELGDISNLSSDDGCFEVGDLTESDVTINDLLNFDPYPGCDPCVECNGVTYAYQICGELEPTTYYVHSHQAIPIGEVFYNPIEGACCFRVDEPVGTPNGTIYGTITYGSSESSCDNCENNIPILYNARICGTNQEIGVMSNIPLITDDVVRIRWGSNSYLCVSIGSEIIGGSDLFPWYDTVRDGNGDTIVYSDCETCKSNVRFGVTLINCGSFIETNISIPYDDYMTSIGGLFNTFLADNGKCYFSNNDCIIPLSSTTVQRSFVNSYINCSYCNEASEVFVFSAGTPYEVCVICDNCCGSGATATSVSVPHPTWTRPDGKSVILLDAVELGGMFGLNS